ncbi:MAG TPA: glycoside hydrolase domain-containing protein, partial [Hanamia sp.]|nr:glycoside hydrolase domain-containing protein [Hanamia sp.]
MKKKLLLCIPLFMGFSAFSQNIPRTNCDSCWNPDSLGNHRVVVAFDDTGNIAKANIEWRRRDFHPELKRIIVEDAKTHQKVLNVKTDNIDREAGEIYFEPLSGKGIYYIYYMPYKNEGRSNYPKGVYLNPENTASAEWLKGIEKNKNIPVVKLKEIQSINAFNSFYPMEIIATKAETQKIIQQNKNQPFVIFPEDRLHSIRMKNDLPKRWIEKGIKTSFADTAMKGENFAYQLGIYALEDLKNITVHFSDLKDENGNIISEKNMSCLNTSGTDYEGKPMQKIVDVEKGNVQPLWCLINIPENTSAGKYTGKVIVTSDKNSIAKEITVLLFVKNEIAKNQGVNEPWKMTRLTWLNSTMAQDNTVIAPYIPLKVSGNEISLLGRKVSLDASGLPGQIQTFFTSEMTGYQKEPNNLLTEAIHFHFTKKSDKKNISLKKGGVKYTLQQAGTVQWNATNTSDDLQMDVEGSLEFDGFLSYKVKVTALNDIELSNISMHIPFEKKEAKYIMGLGLKGEQRP